MNRNFNRSFAYDEDLYDLEPLTTPKNKEGYTEYVSDYKILSNDEIKQLEEFLKYQSRPLKKKLIKQFSKDSRISYTKIMSYIQRCSDRKEKELRSTEFDFVMEMRITVEDVKLTWKNYIFVSEMLMRKYYLGE